MVVRLVFRFGRKKTPAQQRDLRFQRVIQAASRTPFYEPYILSGAGWTESELRDLPYVPFEDVRRKPQAFRNPLIPIQQRHDLHFPFPRPERAAVLAPGFGENSALRVFPTGWSPRLNEFEPEVLAAPLERLKHLAAAVLQKRVKMAPVHRAVIAFVGFEHGMMKREDRDLLWRAFRVPVFEQFLVQGETMASECEAHEGMHLFQERGIYEQREQSAGRELVVTCLRPLPLPVLRWTTGLVGERQESRCGCGEYHPRIVPATPSEVPRFRDAAALARTLAMPAPPAAARAFAAGGA